MQIQTITTPAEHATADEFLLSHPAGSLWQSGAWGRFQSALGHQAHRFLAFDTHHRPDPTLPGELVAVAQVIERKLPLGQKTWYVPRGPVWNSDTACRALVEQLTAAGKKAGALSICFDPFENLPADLPTVPSHSVQPEDTLLLDLALSPEELLAQMKPKGRYNINLAEKKGVTVRIGKNAKHFYHLLQTTTARDGFRGWDEAFYSKMLKNLGSNVLLLEAVYEGEVLAAGIFTFFGTRAVYYYGASSDHHRNLMAPYLLQWHAILEAQKRGCLQYDFLGIAPEGVTDHPWAGVTEFKLKFGGARVHYPQAREVVLKPLRKLALRMLKRR